ncbi:MAG: hypothetical protein LBR93_03285 [Treponema sp.]|nr:hypothetical protein [Treponema sp.]
MAVQYRAADKAGKKRILDEFTVTTGYHRKYAITFTKGRTGRKHDNGWVEQENNSTVQKTAGYSPYSGDKAVQALLNRAIENLEQHADTFNPS